MNSIIPLDHCQQTISFASKESSATTPVFDENTPYSLPNAEDLSIIYGLEKAKEIKVTPRERALIQAIGDLEFKARNNACYASQKTLGKMASKRGWKTMSRQQTNECLNQHMTPKGLVQLDDRGYFKTRLARLTDTAKAIYMVITNKAVDKTTENDKQTAKKPPPRKNPTQNINLTLNFIKKLRSDPIKSPPSVDKSDYGGLISLFAQRRIPEIDKKCLLAWIHKNSYKDLVPQAMDALRLTEKRNGPVKSPCGYLRTIIQQKGLERACVQREQRAQQMKMQEIHCSQNSPTLDILASKLKAQEVIPPPMPAPKPKPAPSQRDLEEQAINQTKVYFEEMNVKQATAKQFQAVFKLKLSKLMKETSWK